MQKINGLRSKMDQFNSVQTLLEDAETLYEMFKEMGDDEELLKETAEAADKATEALEKMELETLTALIAREVVGELCFLKFCLSVFSSILT